VHGDGRAAGEPYDHPMADLAYADRGSGEPLVFLHGIAASHAMWEPVVERLESTRRCVAIDLPGHGASPDGDLGALPMVEAVHRVIVELGLGTPLFVGHSLGGLVSTLHAATHGARGVINVDQVLDLAAFEDALGPDRARFRDHRFPEVWAEFLAAQRPDLVPESRRGAVLADIRPRQDVVLALWGDVLDHGAAAVQPVLDGALGAVACPYLAIYGEVPNDDVRAAVERIPGAQLEVWDDHGHFLHLVDVDRFVSRVMEFEGTLD